MAQLTPPAPWSTRNDLGISWQFLGALAGLDFDNIGLAGGYCFNFQRQGMEVNWMSFELVNW